MFHYWTDGTPEAHVFSFQLAWLLSEAVQGAADAHELFRVAKRVRSGNSRDWHDAFNDMGRKVQGIADEAAEAGHDATASAAYFRAFTYFRSAERILPGSDERKPAFYRTAMSCYGNGMRLSEHTCQNIEFPYESHRLAGLFFPPRLPIKDHPPPCVIFLSGADALPEENFFRGIQYVTARGAACLVFNGPGQGSTLRVLGLPTIPEYERPVTAAVDYLMTRNDIDHVRIGLMGVSFAGYYGPRAVAFEHRIKGCVVWGALYDVLSDIYDYYPPLRKQLQWIVGAASHEEARERYKEFTLEGLLQHVECPVLITHGARDRMVPPASAERTYRELRVEDKELRFYHDEEGGAEHCSMDNWTQVIPYQVDWLLDRI